MIPLNGSDIPFEDAFFKSFLLIFLYKNYDKKSILRKKIIKISTFI